MTYRSIGWSGFEEPCQVNPDSYEYIAPSAAYKMLEDTAQDIVTALVTGPTTSIRFCGVWVADAIYASDIAAIFSGHLQTARLIGAAVLSSIVDEERGKAQRLTTISVAGKLITEITRALRNGGDPAACQMAFEDSFRSWAALTNLSVPTTISKTGWCEKSLALPMKAGQITGCTVQAVCRSGVTPAGVKLYYSSPPPDPSDPRLAVKAPGDKPATPPTRAEVEAGIQRKMKEQGETVESENRAAEFTELASYLKALGEARTYLSMALGLSDKASEKDIMASLGTLGILPSEALDWFDGCRFDTNCFREQMNIAIGEAKQRVKDNRVKIVVATAAVGAVAWWVLRGRS